MYADNCPKQGGILFPSQVTEMDKLLEQFQDLFKEPTGLPPTRELDHVILLKEGFAPIQSKLYRYPHSQKEEIEKLVLLVMKQDRTWRMCVDYHSLNRATVKHVFPIHVIEELINELWGATYFTRLDLRSGYHKIGMRHEDISKTTFQMRQGLFEYKVMPFGLCNAPTTFQALMNQNFQPLLRQFILFFSMTY